MEMFWVDDVPGRKFDLYKGNELLGSVQKLVPTNWRDLPQFQEDFRTTADQDGEYQQIEKTRNFYLKYEDFPYRIWLEYPGIVLGWSKTEEDGKDYLEKFFDLGFVEEFEGVHYPVLRLRLNNTVVGEVMRLVPEKWESWNGYGPNDDNSDVPECEIEIIERNKKIFKECQDKPWRVWVGDKVVGWYSSLEEAKRELYKAVIVQRQNVSLPS